MVEVLSVPEPEQHTDHHQEQLNREDTGIHTSNNNVAAQLTKFMFASNADCWLIQRNSTPLAPTHRGITFVTSNLAVSLVPRLSCGGRESLVHTNRRNPL